MRVQRDRPFYENREFYIVTDDDGKRWWTASWQGDGWYLMTGNIHRVVNPLGKLGKKIVAAIDAFKRASPQSNEERSDEVRAARTDGGMTQMESSNG